MLGLKCSSCTVTLTSFWVETGATKYYAAVQLQQHQQQQQQLTGVSLPISTDVGNATDPADLQRTGLPDEAAAQTPLVHQCYDEVPPRQHAGLQLPDGNGALLNTDPSTLCCLQTMHFIITVQSGKPDVVY